MKCQNSCRILISDVVKTWYYEYYGIMWTTIDKKYLDNLLLDLILNQTLDLEVDVTNLAIGLTSR